MSEYKDIADALKREYGHKFTARGATHYDFSRHFYVGRAGALLLKAARTEKLLRDALEALEHHQEQTRPIPKTEAAIAAIRELLGHNAQLTGAPLYGRQDDSRDVGQDDVKPLFELRGINGEVWMLYENGTATGFPDGAVIVNRAIPEFDLLRGRIKKFEAALISDQKP